MELTGRFLELEFSVRFKIIKVYIIQDGLLFGEKKQSSCSSTSEIWQDMLGKHKTTYKSGLLIPYWSFFQVNPNTFISGFRCA